MTNGSEVQVGPCVCESTYLLPGLQHHSLISSIVREMSDESQEGRRKCSVTMRMRDLLSSPPQRKSSQFLSTSYGGHETNFSTGSVGESTLFDKLVADFLVGRSD